MGGQPCVWCNGAVCHNNGTNRCEVYDVQVNGKGKVMRLDLGPRIWTGGTQRRDHPLIYQRITVNLVQTWNRQWLSWRVHRFTCRGHFSIIRKMYFLVKTMISQGGIQYVSFVECNRLLPLRVVHLIWFICQSSSWNSQNDPTMESYVSPLHFFEILMTTLVARTYAHNAHGWKEVIRRKQPKKRSLFWAPQRNVHPWNST